MSSQVFTAEQPAEEKKKWESPELIRLDKNLIAGFDPGVADFNGTS